jgi:hypothetical protein
MPQSVFDVTATTLDSLPAFRSKGASYFFFVISNTLRVESREWTISVESQTHKPALPPHTGFQPAFL